MFKMRYVITSLATLFIVNIFMQQGKCNFASKRRAYAKILGFSWENCGKSGDPIVTKILEVSPDPISVPGDLNATATASTAVELAAPLSLNVTLDKDVAGFWVKVPCVEQLGSCDYSDACELLDSLIPPGQDCPEPLHTYGIPCHCPFKAGEYSLPPSEFHIPDVDLPFWLTNGKYKVEGILGNKGQELGCLKVSFALHST
ncbi:ganglioside GM2 activator [Megalops cyprinoides]|uniref:ganglioside GM2 activator n=1 Tax=Megalops cyprinoides TaxID=118141 RepID=UPI0018645949|nr:ganglioside GM2 activator [Megalops cyprinoides]